MSEYQDKKILIIEDDAVVAGIYQRHLTRNGFNVEWKDGIQEGFYRAQLWRPNAVILDLVFPKVNHVELTSLDVLKKLKAQNQFAHCIFIVLTNAFMSELAEKAADAGADWILDKSRTTPGNLIEIFHKVWRGWWENRTLNTLDTLKPTSDPKHSDGAPAMPVAEGADTPEAGEQTAPLKKIPSIQKVPVGSPVPDPKTVDLWVDPKEYFRKNTEVECKELREMFLGFAREKSIESRKAKGQSIALKLDKLTGAASTIGLFEFAGVTAAMHALIVELSNQTAPINAGTNRTLASAVDFLIPLMDKIVKTSGDLPFVSFSILAVDDDPFARQAVKRACIKVGLKAVTVGDPDFALKLIEENQFDLILLDVEMPDMNGFELCKSVRANKLNKRTPVLFVTGHDDLQSRSQSLLSGGNDFIVKPFPFMELGLKILIASMKSR